MVKKLGLLFLSLFLLSTLTACNTVEGVGRDVKALGNTVEDSAEDNKNY